MRDTFDRIDNRAGKVVGGIHLPLITVSMSETKDSRVEGDIPCAVMG